MNTGSPPPRDGLGSSEGAAVLGLDPFRSPFDVLRAKLEGVSSTADNPMMKWGRLLEDVVAADFQERTGIELHRILEAGHQRTLRMKGHPIITARLDRRTRRAPREIVEVKTSPYGTGFGDAGELADDRAGGPDGIPPRVRVQVYHQLAVTGYRRAIVAVLIGGYQRRDYIVPRDEDLIGDYVAELEEWWERHYVRREPLPLDGSAAADAYLRAKYPRETEDVITATPEQQALVAQLRTAKTAAKAWQAQEALARQQVADAIGAHAGMLFPGGRITYKAHDVRSVSWETVARAYRTLVEETRSLYDDAALADLTSTVRAALEDLDAIESIHTNVRTDRPLKLTVDKEEQP